MQVIDTDAELLGKSAHAAAHAAEQTKIHIDAEIVGKVPELLDTLTDDGPYAYTLLSEVDGDGSVRIPIMTTRGQIREAYTMIRGASALLKVEPLVEVRGSWYTFHEAISTGLRRGADASSESVTLALFPSTGGKGITGELVWVYRPPATLGTGVPRDETRSGWQLRREVVALHDSYLQALRAADVDGVLAVLADGAQSAVRDYVTETGVLTTLDGLEAHRTYYEALFDRYRIESVDLLDRVTQDWYVFAELRFTVSPRVGDGGRVAFHTAEFHMPARDGRFIGRIGHGTDPR